MTPRVLIADDHEDGREALAWFLRAEGFRVTTASNGYDTLRDMAIAAPDVLILDLDMPVISGWDVLDRMTLDPALRGIPTMVVSGHVADRRTPRDVIALMKPIDHDRLLAVVRALAGSGRRPPGEPEASTRPPGERRR
jgi:CheY-like chemotaxis protein